MQTVSAAEGFIDELERRKTDSQNDVDNALMRRLQMHKSLGVPCHLSFPVHKRGVLNILEPFGHKHPGISNTSRLF